MNIGSEYVLDEELGKNREMSAAEDEDEGLWGGPDTTSHGTTLVTPART
jgi:hypothetical protein